jgi:hypothetical protein
MLISMHPARLFETIALLIRHANAQGSVAM